MQSGERLSAERWINPASETSGLDWMFILTGVRCKVYDVCFRRAWPRELIHNHQFKHIGLPHASEHCPVSTSTMMTKPWSRTKTPQSKHTKEYQAAGPETVKNGQGTLLGLESSAQENGLKNYIPRSANATSTCAWLALASGSNRARRTTTSFSDRSPATTVTSGERRPDFTGRGHVKKSDCPLPMPVYRMQVSYATDYDGKIRMIVKL